MLTMLPYPVLKIRKDTSPCIKARLDGAAMPTLPIAHVIKLATSPALYAYGFKVANALAAFAATAMLARMAGPAVVGNYSFAVVTATLLGLISIHGLDQVMLREVAGDLRQHKSGAARGVVGFATRSVAFAVLLTTAVFIGAALDGHLTRRLEMDQSAVFGAAVGIASAAFYRLGLAGLRAAGRPVAGQFWEGANSFLFAAIVGALWLAARQITAVQAVLLFFGCQFLSAVVIWLIIRRDARTWDAATAPDGKRLRKSGFPIMAIQGTQMFQDWLLFALVAGAANAAAVGALRVAMQVVVAITIVVNTGENFIAARVAGDLRAGRPDLVWRRHRRATLAMGLAIGPLILICIAFPTQLLGLAFGPAFAVAGPALAIMAAGQATKIVTGPIGGLLTMSGHERWLLRFTIVGLALLVGLALWLVPIWGLEGAAIAQAVSVAFRNVAGFTAASLLIPKVAPVTEP
jgi:O-antigen/teichoic acid export membrane protein